MNNTKMTRFTYTSPQPSKLSVQHNYGIKKEPITQYPIYPVYEVVYEVRRKDVKSPLIASRILK